MKVNSFFGQENKVNRKTKIHLKMLGKWGIYTLFYYTVHIMYHIGPIYFFLTYEHSIFVLHKICY